MSSSMRTGAQSGLQLHVLHKASRLGGSRGPKVAFPLLAWLATAVCLPSIPSTQYSAWHRATAQKWGSGATVWLSPSTIHHWEGREELPCRQRGLPGPHSGQHLLISMNLHGSVISQAAISVSQKAGPPLPRDLPESIWEPMRLRACGHRSSILKSNWWKTSMDCERNHPFLLPL